MISLPLGLVASEFWMTRWLTGFWLMGTGVAVGMLVLLLFLGLFRALSNIPGMDTFRKSGAAFWVSVLISAILAGLGSILVRSTFGNNFRSDEWGILVIASWPIYGVLVAAILYCSQKRFLGEIWGTLTQGIGAWVGSIGLSIAVLGVACWPLVDEPAEVLQSLGRFFSTGEVTSRIELAGNSSQTESSVFLPLNLKYEGSLVDSVRIESDRNVVLADSDQIENTRSLPTQIEARTPLKWSRRDTRQAPIPLSAGANIFAQNLEIDPAILLISIHTLPPYPEAAAVIFFALVTTFIGLVWMLQQAAAPKLSAIAMAASKSELSQPLPLILMLIGSMLLVAFVYLPFHTEGEDIKMLKDCGLTLILILAIFQGVWSASSTVSDEIEGRTALTLLSKPIHRRSFIIGKMLGIFWVLFFMFLVLGAVFLLTVAYKPIYDSRETSTEMPLWQGCYAEMIRTIPGLIMGFCQACTLSAIAVALATRVPQLANFAICFSIYLVGHLTPTIVSSGATEFPIIQFVAQLIAVVIPTLDWYSMDKAIDTGNSIPLVYLAGIILYSMVYTAIAVLLGLLLFEDRDLA